MNPLEEHWRKHQIDGLDQLATAVEIAAGADDLATPDTLRITQEHDLWVTRGGPDGQLVVAAFVSKNAAEHFVRYCVEKQKTFAGVRP